MNTRTLLQQTAHRTAPMPSGPWIMVQKWHDLLFAHWTIPVEKLRPLVPGELELDLRDGKAYLAVAPFWMSGIRGRAMPKFPGVHTFAELNVRTYVTYRNSRRLFLQPGRCQSHRRKRCTPILLTTLFLRQHVDTKSG